MNYEHACLFKWRLPPQPGLLRTVEGQNADLARAEAARTFVRTTLYNRYAASYRTYDGHPRYEETGATRGALWRAFHALHDTDLDYDEFLDALEHLVSLGYASVAGNLWRYEECFTLVGNEPDMRYVYGLENPT